jgi:hypothetical protein
MIHYQFQLHDPEHINYKLLQFLKMHEQVLMDVNRRSSAIIQELLVLLMCLQGLQIIESLKNTTKSNQLKVKQLITCKFLPG